MGIDTETLTRADVAWLVGMSDSWVRDRMQAGDLPRPGATAEEYVEAFVAFKLRRFERTDAAGDGLDLEAERARLAKEQADGKALDNAERRKELASLPDMTTAVVGVITLAVSRLQQVPALVAKGDVAGVDFAQGQFATCREMVCDLTHALLASALCRRFQDPVANPRGGGRSPGPIGS